jgi:predicted small secreted protein
MKTFFFKIIRSAFFLACIVLTGCSTLGGEGSNQSVSVQTIDKNGLEIQGARCDLKNDVGAWFLTTPASISIHRSNKDLQITCRKAGFDIGSASVSSRTKGAMWGTAILTGGVGALVDHNSGAAYEYQQLITVQFNQLDSQSREPLVQSTVNASDRLSNQIASENLFGSSRAEITKPQSGSSNSVVGLSNRKALVVGNDSYRSVPRLENAREDARTIASNLTAVGYQVTLKLDLNEKEMKSALRTFASQVQGGDEVMFFFAGHGVQLGAANFLLPTDIVGDSEAQVRDEAIQLQRVLDDMSEKKAKFTLAMIDACRDNPFKTTGRSIGGRGLAPTTAATGQMVIFSAGTGQQALDRLGATDKNKNGLFTRVFVQEMQKPNVSIDRVVKNVRNQVAELAKSVGHEQVPAIYDQVLGDFYFKK